VRRHRALPLPLPLRHREVAGARLHNNKTIEDMGLTKNEVKSTSEAASDREATSESGATSDSEEMPTDIIRQRDATRERTEKERLNY